MMARSAKRLLLWTVLAVPVLGASVSYLEGQEKIAPPTKFQFDSRLFDPSRKNQRATLPKGALLQPIELAEGGLLYQPVALCDEVELVFDSSGLSQPVKVDGFCYGPGVQVPPPDVRWRITGLFVEEIKRAKKCDPEEIRQRQVQPQPPMGKTEAQGTGPGQEQEPQFTSFECSKIDSECRKDFDELLRRHFGKSLREAEEDRTCATVFGPRDGYNRVLILKCLTPKPPRSRR